MRIYEEESGTWFVDDSILEALDNDLQLIVRCTEDGDTVLFQSSQVIKPQRTVTISWNLTFSTEPDSELLSQGTITETESKVRFQCPEDGGLLSVR